MYYVLRITHHVSCITLHTHYELHFTLAFKGIELDREFLVLLPCRALFGLDL
jgi:hypothetical protein